MKKDAILEKVMGFATKMQNNKYLAALSQGLMGTLPILMIGSIALLLAVLPIDAWKSFIATTGLQGFLLTASTLTTSLIALYGTFAIAYRLAEKFEQQALIPGIVAVFCFLMITPMATADVNGVATSFLDTNWLGAKGLFTGIVVSLTATKLYCFMVEKKLTIKMPDSVPPVIANSFAGLIPAILTGIVFLLVAYVFSFTPWGSFASFIYTVISMPLQSLSSSMWSMVFIVFIQMILWFFGLHGSLVVGPFIQALYLPMDTANMDALAAGQDLPNILTKSFYDCFAGIGGAGGTLSLVILMLIMAKSQKNKALAKMAIVPGCFTINEPVVFGYPLILNPIMAIPFIMTPLVQVIVAYLAIASGIFPRLTGVQVPFGFPVGVNGFLAGGWMIALLQIICVAVGVLIWYPFLKISDRQEYKVEMGEVSTEE